VLVFVDTSALVAIGNRHDENHFLASEVTGSMACRPEDGGVSKPD